MAAQTTTATRLPAVPAHAGTPDVGERGQPQRPAAPAVSKKVGFAANRRLLGVERLSHDCTIGADVLAALHRPAQVDGQRASILRFGDPRVQALLAALLRFDLLPAGFRNRELREAVAPLRGMSLDDYNAGHMTYDLRRLRLRGLIERIPHSQRYRLTAEGLCIALAYHRTQACVLGPVLSATLDGAQGFTAGGSRGRRGTVRSLFASVERRQQNVGVPVAGGRRGAMLAHGGGRAR